MTAVSSNDSEKGGDPRYTLTPEERADVLELKASCDELGIKYDSIFELAKFCLVSSSIKNDEKRRADSLGRLKKRREFEKKHQLDKLDVFDCWKIMNKEMPDFSVACGKLGGKHCLGYTSTGTDPSFFKRVDNALEIVCKVEMMRYELAAADLEEAREGFYILSSMKGLKGSPLAAARMGVGLRVLFDKMNANRIKGIYVESPRALAMMGSMILNVLPKKIKSRVAIGNHLEDLKINTGNDFHANIPNNYTGGKFDQSVEDWMIERIEVLNETKRLVKL